MKNIQHLLDIVDGVRDHVALGLMSDPGLSKTSQVKQWAEKNDRRYCELIISQRMPSEISGMPMPVAPPKGQTHGTMEVYDFNTLLELEKGDVLAFDEFTNGNIQTLNACLTLIQERVMLSGKKLPSLIITAMGNPQGKCELLPQTKQRFWWVDVVWDEQTWKDYMLGAWEIMPTRYVMDAIKKQYQKGFGNAEKNYLTPRTVENLFRIAQQHPRDDVFWTLGDLDTRLVDEIYTSLTNVSTYSKVSPLFDEWGNKMAAALKDDEQSSELLIEMVAELAACHSPDDVKAVVTKLQSDFRYDMILPDFIEFLKTTGINDKETIKINAADEPPSVTKIPVKDSPF